MARPEPEAVPANGPASQPIRRYPHPGSIFIYSATRHGGPHDPYENPYTGWAAAQAGDGAPFVICGSLQEAQREAEKRWPEIIGWAKSRNQYPDHFR